MGATQNSSVAQVKISGIQESATMNLNGGGFLPELVLKMSKFGLNRGGGFTEQEKVKKKKLARLELGASASFTLADV